MPNVDSLNISISGTAQRASSSLDTVIGKLDTLSSSLRRINTGSLNSMSNGFERFGRAMSSFNMSNVNSADLKTLATGIDKLASIDSGKILNASNAMDTMAKSINTISAISSASANTTASMAELAKGIAQLGYKSSTKAIDNIPKLAVSMRQLITELSKAPKVSQNVIDLTNALAKLARTGASSGKAATSLGKSLNIFSKSTKTAKTGAFSLASAIGKIYATYWMLFRAFNKIKEAMSLSSELTETQNVVNVTFGKYSSAIEDFAKTSISQFGISEITAKKTASVYQSMGTAMGFSQKKMSDMSVELTKLSADMASFYNVEQEDVAEDLQSVFTGSTRPLRQYGLDLTNATLKEWAMKNGLDANISSMSQAEKTMLRYQYVMANTGASQGDFQRTQLTWANQTKILTENLKALAVVIGGVFTNAFKPLVIALNSAISSLTAFARTVSDSLGKIFGWQYEEGGGGMASDFEDSADYSEDIADSTGSAADNIEKMKKGLRAFDELKTISIDSGNGTGSGSGGTSGTSTSSSTGSGGEWTKVDSMFENYESALDSLYKLGEYIGTKLTATLNNIDWESVYEGAKNFGSGLANFLNGLISPDLFASLGNTIAGSINTALHALNSFFTTFEWEELGVSLASGLSNFFKTRDFELTAETASNFVSGILRGLTGFFSGLKDEKVFYTLGQKIVDFICGINWLTLVWDFGKLVLSMAEAVYAAPKDLFDGVADAIKEKLEQAFEVAKNWAVNNIVIPLSITVDNIKTKLKEKWEKAKEWWSEVGKVSVGVVVDSIKSKLSSAWSKAKTWWDDKKGSLKKISFSIPSLKTALKDAWTAAKTWWSKNVKLSIPKLDFKVTFKTPTGVIQKAVVKALSLEGWPSLQFFATGGFPEDGTFRASHGEIMGRFDNGQSVVANNKQITDGISDAVYRGNRENNALLRQELQLMQAQNELLTRILEKETGISMDDIFNGVRKKARNYQRETGVPAF